MNKPILKWQVSGLQQSIRGSKFPMAVNTEDCDIWSTFTTDSLALSPIGSGHDQFLTGIVVHMDLCFSIKAWVEAERYHFLDFVSSQSTMHRIERMDIAAQCNEYVAPTIIDIVQALVDRYKRTRDPEDRLRILYSVPTGLTYTASMVTNYRQLKTIYAQRHNHRLPEWRLFCEQLHELPHSEWIVGLNDGQK